jgi:hypothetical protein
MKTQNTPSVIVVWCLLLCFWDILVFLVSLTTNKSLIGENKAYQASSPTLHFATELNPSLCIFAIFLYIFFLKIGSNEF